MLTTLTSLATSETRLRLISLAVSAGEGTRRSVYLTVLFDAILLKLTLSLEFLLDLERQLVNISLTSIFGVGSTCVSSLL